MKRNIHKTSTILGLAFLVLSQILMVAPVPVQADAPENIVWTPHNDGMVGSNIVGAVVDPSASSTVYALTGTAGVYKSTNAGSSWTAVNTGLSTNKAVSSGHLFGNLLTIDQRNPSRLYAAIDGKPFKTTNGGTSWTEISTGISSCGGTYSITGIAIDPLDSDHLFAGYIAAGCAGGLYESTDAGANWTYVPTTGIANDAWALALDPLNSDNMYLGTVHIGLARSTNGGVAWTNTSPTGGNVNGGVIAVHPQTTSRIIASYMDADNSGGLYLSTDSGATWTSKATDVPGPIYDIQFSSTTPATGYAAGINGVYKTTDGGLTWAAVGSHAAKSPKSLAINPVNPNIVYLGSSGNGMYKSTDGGVNFSAVNSGIPISLQVNAVSVAPSNSNIYYANLNGVGFYRSTDRGYTWIQMSSDVTEVNRTQFIAVSPTDPDTLYAGFLKAYKSTDGGATWTQTISPDGGFYAGVVDPGNANHVLVADNVASHLWQTSDGGTSWATSTSLLPSGIGLDRLDFDEADPNKVYAGTYDYFWRSIDNGSTWTKVTTGITGTDNYMIDGLAIDPSNPSTLYISTRGDEVMKSTDAGLSWATTTYASGVASTPQTVKVDPNGVVYAFTLYNWQRSANGGTDWTSMTTSSLTSSFYLPKFSFDVDPADSSRFFMGDYYGGFYIYEDYRPIIGDSSTISVIDDNYPNSDAFHLGSVLTATTTVTNSGKAPATSTVVTFELPESLEYVLGSSHVDGAAVSDPLSTTTLVYNLGSLFSDQSSQITFKFEIHSSNATLTSNVVSAADPSGTVLSYSINATPPPSFFGGSGGGLDDGDSDPASSTPPVTPPVPGSPEALKAQIAALLAQIDDLKIKLGLLSNAAPNPPAFIRDLTLGSRGEDVRSLQLYLNNHDFALAEVGPGSPGNETNVFGVLTKSALAKFQAAKGISPSIGYFGPKTRAWVEGNP